MGGKWIALLGGVAAACSGSDSGLPRLTPLSPDGSRHVAVSYSPDGSRISYWAPTREGAGGWQLWVANADLSAPLPLPVTAEESPPPALWSPDASRLTALSDDFGTADIVAVASAGGTPRRLTEGAGQEVPLQWLTDGERFTYYTPTESGTIQTFAVSTLTGATTRLLPDETRGHIAMISPDGQRIAYQVTGPEYTIWVADSSGRDRHPLTTGGAEFFSPWRNPWSPDGTEILYMSRATGTFDLWIVPVDGSPPRRLTRDDHDDHRGTWSPDGEWIAFRSDRGGQTDVWVVPRTGGAARRVTDTSGNVYSGPLWRPGPSPIVGFVSRTEGVRTVQRIFTADLSTLLGQP